MISGVRVFEDIVWRRRIVGRVDFLFFWYVFCGVYGYVIKWSRIFNRNL